MSFYTFALDDVRQLVALIVRDPDQGLSFDLSQWADFGGLPVRERQLYQTMRMIALVQPEQMTEPYAVVWDKTRPPQCFPASWYRPAWSTCQEIAAAAPGWATWALVGDYPALHIPHMVVYTNCHPDDENTPEVDGVPTRRYQPAGLLCRGKLCMSLPKSSNG